MPTFRVDDLVRIVSNSSYHPHINLAGGVGYISEIRQEGAYVHTLKLNGEESGCGSLEFSCLDLCTDPRWVEAYKIRMEALRKLMAEYGITDNPPPLK